MVIKPLVIRRPSIDELEPGDILRYRDYPEVYDVILPVDVGTPDWARLGERNVGPFDQGRMGNREGFTHSRHRIPAEFYLLRKASEFRTLGMFRILQLSRINPEVTSHFNNVLVELEI